MLEKKLENTHSQRNWKILTKLIVLMIIYIQESHHGCFIRNMYMEIPGYNAAYT